jgi:hypothetical protein
VAWLQPGSNNTVTIIARGKQRGDATIVIADLPGSATTPPVSNPANPTVPLQVVHTTAAATSTATTTATVTAAATAASTAIPTATPTVVTAMATSTALATSTPSPTPIPALAIHNANRTVVGGRTAPCDLPGNTNGAHEPGCEIVSSIWLPGARVTYTITYADGSRQTFTDVADARGHSLHAFNVRYRPPATGHYRRTNMARILVSAVSRDGIWRAARMTRFTVVR